MDNLNEEMKIDKIKQEAETLYEKYRDQMDLFEKGTVCKVKGGLSSYDVYALGKQLQSFDEYLVICEEEGSTNQLGKLPSIAYDVITVAYGTSIIPVVASVQPVDEENGTVYFKNVKAVDTKGNLTAGDSLLNVDTGKAKTGSGYASNVIAGEAIATGDGADKTFAGTLAGYPVRSQTLRITVQDDPTVYGIDDGSSNIIGAGVRGTINYVTGAFDLTFEKAVPNTKVVFASYQQNYELAADIPEITTFWDSKQVMARVYTLKGSIGMLQSYAMKKRFGLVAEDELANDLVGEINAEIGADIVRKLIAAASGNTEWVKAAPEGVSAYEHRQSFRFGLADAESVLAGNAGRGTVSVYIGGRTFCSYISTLPGFVKLTDGNTIGIHIFGTFDGSIVIRVLDASILDANVAICLYKGTSPFEAPAVYTPYMPLVVTSTLPNGVNPLRNQRAAAVWSGCDVLVPNFITKFTVK